MYHLISSRPQMFFRIGVLQNFANLTGKHICWSIILIKLQTLSPATLLKRDSNIGVFLSNLQNLPEHLFYCSPLVAASVHVVHTLCHMQSE